MDWLNDKKNRPIVVVILSVIIVGALVGSWMMFKPASDTSAGMTGDPVNGPVSTDPNALPVATTPDPNAAAGTSAPVTGATGAPAATAPAQGGVQVAAVPMESWRGDPFLPVGYKPIRKPTVKPKPRIYDLPLGALFPPPVMDRDKWKKFTEVEQPQPARRMAGLLLNDRVFAIIESNGSSEIVQPGDVLRDGLAVVEKIERDKVILKTRDKPSRYLTVGMAAAAKTASGASDQNSNTTPSSGSGSSPGRGGSRSGGSYYGP